MDISTSAHIFTEPFRPLWDDFPQQESQFKTLLRRVAKVIEIINNGHCDANFSAECSLTLEKESYKANIDINFDAYTKDVETGEYKMLHFSVKCPAEHRNAVTAAIMSANQALKFAKILRIKISMAMLPDYKISDEDKKFFSELKVYDAGIMKVTEINR